MTRTKKLVFSGVMIALATILSFITIFKMPFGGSITAASMLPIIIVAYRYGVKWGVLTGFVYGLIQMVQGVFMGDLKGLTLGVVIGSIILDYIVAFSMLGLAGMFAKKIKSIPVALALGTLVACAARFVIHFISGFIFFSQWAEWYFTQEGFELGAKIMGQFSGNKLYIIYSAVYNGAYMLPETILTCVLAFISALLLKNYIKTETL